MENWKQLEGQYNLQETQVSVKIIGDRLTATLPGVPPGFEIILESLAEPGHFRMIGGPADRATAIFQTDAEGKVTGILIGGEHQFSRQDGAIPESETPTGQGLHPPPLVLDEAKEARFSALIEAILQRSDGRVIDYDLPYPKHEFLQYAAGQDQFIFHGSGNGDIEEFRIRRTSMELNDKSGSGNVQGIYGTHDGLWPLFFAIVDRGKITGSIRNGFSTFRNDAGEEVRVYHFSINKDWLDERPWRRGTLYFLSRETFKRMPVSLEGGESNQWVSEVPVRPLARLTIEPEDFPFLQQIGGHDDSELLRVGELGKAVTAVVTAANITPENIEMNVAYSDDVGALMLEYIPLAQNFLPSTRFTIRFEPEGQVWFDIAGPPAVMQVMKDRIEAHLKKQGEKL